MVDRYFDRIVLSNPSTMLISMEEYYEGGHSICRNPVIQKMFVFLGIGEKGGTEADVIVKGWKDNGWSIPTIEEKNNPDRIEICLKLEGDTSVTTETTTVTTETTTGTTTETILKMISNKPKITIKEMASACGITEDGTAYHIKKLKQSGRITRIGGTRYGGEWKVN